MPGNGKARGPEIIDGYADKLARTVTYTYIEIMRDMVWIAARGLGGTDFWLADSGKMQKTRESCGVSVKRKG
jgi:hypothetical protein